MTGTAFITGISGQDGSYLAQLLLSKGYEVHGLIRRSSTSSASRIHTMRVDPSLFLHYGDMTDSEQINNVISKIEPDEVYNLAAQSHVRVSFESPENTGNVTGLGTVRILEAIRRCSLDIKFYQASSSEMFGGSPPPQNEDTPFHPCSPYACAKLYSYWMTRNYREGYGLKASNGILFNHESPRRGESFVTRKITMAIARIKAGTESSVSLGNLDARRDWGYAPEYMEGAWKILQCGTPGDYVLGTGESHTIREFIEKAFAYAGLDPEKHVTIDKKYFRPTEVNELRADCRKAQKYIGWSPKVKFDELVKIMVDSDMKALGGVLP